jgi:hypothetical protein
MRLRVLELLSSLSFADDASVVIVISLECLRTSVLASFRVLRSKFRELEFEQITELDVGIVKLRSGKG